MCVEHSRLLVEGVVQYRVRTIICRIVRWFLRPFIGIAIDDRRVGVEFRHPPELLRGLVAVPSCFVAKISGRTKLDVFVQVAVDVIGVSGVESLVRIEYLHYILQFFPIYRVVAFPVESMKCTNDQAPSIFTFLQKNV